MSIQIEKLIKEKTGRDIITSSSYTNEWLDWYKGNVDTFHTYKMFNGISDVTQHRKTLNMAKKCCEDWANLLLNEKTDVAIEGEQNQENLNRLLMDLGFWSKGNEGIEKTFSLGQGAFVESFTADGMPKVQFINRTKIYPLEIVEGVVTECAFVSENSNNVVIQIHIKDGVGNYVVRTLIGMKDNDNIKFISDDIYETNTNIPFFQCYKPAIANNIDIDSPLGISIFANAIDEMKGVDLAFDGYCNEMEVGKLRAFVNKKLTKFVDGEKTPIFNNRDTFFYIAGDGSEENKEQMKFYAPTLRVTDYFNGINNALNLFSSKVGFGANHYRFDQNGLSTATQVISENSDMFRTIKKHEILLNEVLIGVVRALIYICNTQGNGKYKFEDRAWERNIEIKFDDSIIEDKEAQKISDRQDVNMGVMSKAEYRAKWYNEDLEQAQANIQAIQEIERVNTTNFFSEV